MLNPGTHKEVGYHSHAPSKGNFESNGTIIGFEDTFLFLRLIDLTSMVDGEVSASSYDCRVVQQHDRKLSVRKTSKRLSYFKFSLPQNLHLWQREYPLIYNDFFDYQIMCFKALLHAKLTKMAELLELRTEIPALDVARTKWNEDVEEQGSKVYYLSFYRYDVYT